MLTEKDIRLMHDWRDELIHLRRREVALVYYVTETDDFTGEIIRKEKKTKQVKSVVTEIDCKEDREHIGGIYAKKGDIQLSLKIEEVEDVIDEIVQVVHDGEEYEILSKDKKGIGLRNRFEVLGRRIT